MCATTLILQLVCDLSTKMRCRRSSCLEVKKKFRDFQSDGRRIIRMGVTTLLEEEKKGLVEHLWHKGIKDEALLKAIYIVPREKFISDALRKFAYDDNALPIECAQTISQPFTVAYMTQALAVKPGEKVLEIGTGSGYQTAILSAMGAEVYTVERIEKLY